MVSEMVSFLVGEGHEFPMKQVAVKIPFFQAKWVRLYRSAEIK